MEGIAALIILFAIVVYVANYINRRRWRRKSKVFCYFEYEYNGKAGTSRDYGPMQEVDAVGAMDYRQKLGATITFEKFSTNIEEIHDLIDLREFMHNNRKERARQ